MYYKSWVPTVTGHLSFTAIGDTDYPARCERFGDPRYFCILQKRSLLDVVVPLPFSGRFAIWLREQFARLVFRRSGNFEFAIFGEYNEEHDRLEGTLFLTPSRFLDNEEYRVKVANLCSQGRNGRLLEHRASEFRDFISEFCRGSATFQLLRNGEIFIDTRYETNNSERRRFDGIIASQLYFFVKDIFHKHQHHDSAHDAIIPLFSVDHKDDNSWIKKTQHRLFRQMIRYKRYRDQRTLYRASGILAYAKAFEENFSEIGPLQSYRTDQLEQSLSVKREEIQHFDQLSLSRQQTLVTWFFSISAFLVSLAAIARLDKDFTVEASPIIHSIVNFVAQYPAAVLAIIWLTAKSLRMWAYKENPSDWPIIRNIYQLMRGNSIERFIGVLTTIGLSLLVFSLWLAYSAIFV